MSATFDVTILWTVIQDVLDKLKSKKEDTIEANRLIGKAFNHTYDYLKNKNGAYVPNTDLADLWNDAAAAVLKVDIHLGELLLSKSRFWTHPNIYFELGREKEIPELKEIVSEMEKLRLRLK